jgi:predicted Rossmann fold flavoprotein
MTENFHTIIIGAGAAGLLAGATAAQHGHKTLILEKMSRPARKLRITGKGRCNITNSAPKEEFLTHFGDNADFLRPAFNQFFSNHIIKLLNQLGVATVTERGGRVFPASGKATDVVDALTAHAKKSGAKIQCNQTITKLIIKDNIAIGVQNNNGSSYYAKKIILATGGKSYPATGSTGDGYRLTRQAGHTIITPRPALVPLTTDAPFLQKLDGLNLRNIRITVIADQTPIAQHFGELTFNANSIAGPTILTASGNIIDHLNNGQTITISIDLKPALSAQKLANRIQRDLQKRTREPISSILRGLLPRQLIRPILRNCKIQGHRTGNSIKDRDQNRLQHALKNFPIKIIGHRPWSEAIITAGGVDTAKIDPTTMQSQITPNLHIIGELLNIQADTGGYNLQAAFSTAHAAAK